MAKAIILIGIQGSGKSTFYGKKFSEYVHVNLDTLHTRKKEKILVEECLNEKRSFVVDNTNPTKEERAYYIQAAKAHGYEIEGYFLQSILAECIKRNQNRTGKARIPDKAIACTSNKLEMPSYEEGFDKLYFVKTEQGEFVVEAWKQSDSEG